MLYNAGYHLCQSLNTLLQGTPANVNPAKVQARLEQSPNIQSVHDLHTWC
ncbi:hypothetical protein [Pontibacter chitinilyticus]